MSVGGRFGIKEIAQESRVSIATVSRVLNGAATVDPTLAEQVLKAAARLGYRPNGVARSLRLRRTMTLGAVIPTITNPYFTDAVRAMQDAATAAGYTLLVANSDRDPAKEDAALTTLLDRRVDGLVLVSSASAAADAAPSPALRAVLDAATPIVAMDRALPSLLCDRVVVDTRAGASGAVRHLVERGRRRIAFIAGPPSISTAAEKRLGYEEALRAAGLPLDPALVLPGDYTLESGEAMAERLLRLDPPVDAVLVANNLMTLGVLRVLLRRDVRIPERLAMIGYDDVAWTVAVRPALTVVSQPTYELGQEAIRLLLERMAAPHAAPEVRALATTLIVREST